MCVLIVDEAHHTRKATSNANLMRKVYEDYDSDEEFRPLILGMTASPIDRMQKDLSEATVRVIILKLLNYILNY